jgi:single-strand DNA-binding protein
MSTTITGKLNKPANQFQAGESIGFGIRLGVKYRDPKTKQDEWTNYSAVVFAKAQGQIKFYQDVLVEGAVVEVSGDTLKIESFDGQNGPVLTIELLNARLGFVHAPQGMQAPQPQAQQQYQQPPQQQYAPPAGAPPQQYQQQGTNTGAVPQQYQQAAPMDDFPDDVPF